MTGNSVCFLTTAHDTASSRVVHREARSLSAAGYDVTYYTPLDDGSVEGIDVVSYGPDRTQESVPTVPNRLRWALVLARRLARASYDVYHFHDVELLPVGVHLRATTDAPVVYDVHENVPDVLAHKDVFPAPVRSQLSVLASGAELGLARLIDALVVASPDLAERFDGHDDVTVVTNYPLRRWAENTDPTGDREGDTTQFVYCGLLSVDRGILTLIDAIERVPDEDVSLVLGGKFASETEEARIRGRIDESDRTEFVGWLPTLEAMIELFRESSVGLLCFHPAPNKTDAMHRSNKLFQYMAAGIPILVSDVGGWPDLVSDVGCGVAVDPEDPAAIADAMTSLADDPDWRDALGKAGHEAALDRFNWETQRRNLLGLYDRLTT